jgi:hypothetical protein
VPIFADRGGFVLSATDPYVLILDFLDRAYRIKKLKSRAMQKGRNPLIVIMVIIIIIIIIIVVIITTTRFAQVPETEKRCCNRSI